MICVPPIWIPSLGETPFLRFSRFDRLCANFACSGNEPPTYGVFSMATSRKSGARKKSGSSRSRSRKSGARSGTAKKSSARKSSPRKARGKRGAAAAKRAPRKSARKAISRARSATRTAAAAVRRVKRAASGPTAKRVKRVAAEVVHQAAGLGERAVGTVTEFVHERF